MSGSREMSTTRHRLDTASQSSDEFLQQFPAPPVPRHFSDMNAIDNHESHGFNEKANPESNAPTLSNFSMAANAPPVQKPNDNSDHRSNPVATTAAAQRQPNIPNAYALNTDFTFVDRPEKKVHWTKRNCFFRWICCSMCFPPWVAYILWFIVIALIICIIVIGALLGSFKMPTIDFAGLNSTLPNGTQQIEFSSTGVVIHAGLILNVMNPNVLSMKLSDLTAKAYYPINGTMVQIGKGYLDYQFIPQKSDINFTYPFQIDYNPSDPNSRYLLSSISDKCGFTGNTPSDIDISYEVSLNAQVLFVHVSPTISSSASFACPFQKGQIPGLSSTGSSGQGGLDGILGGLGAQVNETSSTTTTHPTARATALPSSLSTTTARSAFSSSTSTQLPSTAQSTRSSAISSAVPAVVHLSTALPSSMVTYHTTAPTMSSMPLLASTLAASITSRAAPTTPSAVAPANIQPRVMSSSTTHQPTSKTTSIMHTSSTPATSVRPTATTPRSSTSRPTPTPEDNGDDDDQDDGDDDDQDDGDDDDTDEDDDGDDGDDDGDDEQ